MIKLPLLKLNLLKLSRSLPERGGWQATKVAKLVEKTLQRARASPACILAVPEPLQSAREIQRDPVVTLLLSCCIAP